METEPRCFAMSNPTCWPGLDQPTKWQGLQVSLLGASANRATGSHNRHTGRIRILIQRTFRFSEAESHCVLGKCLVLVCAFHCHTWLRCPEEERQVSRQPATGNSQPATCNLQLATAITRRFKVCPAAEGKEFLAAGSRKT